MNSTNKTTMKRKTIHFVLAACLGLGAALPAFEARAQVAAGASALSAVSALPVMSIAGTDDVSGAAIALPVMFSMAGAELVVKSARASARGTEYVLERASDGASATVEIVSKGAGAVSLATGTLVTVSTVSAGVVLSAAGQAIAFLPNALGRALLHNERVSN